jgi:hypothetical protein
MVTGDPILADYDLLRRYSVQMCGFGKFLFTAPRYAPARTPGR